MKKTILILIACFWVFQSQAQNCNELYKQALQKYQNGDVQAAYDLLQNCLSSRELLSKTERDTKGNVYWLSTQSSILLQKNAEAKLYLKKMLSLRPYYEPDKDDLQDVGNMMNELVVRPRVSLRVMTGLTGSFENLQESYEIFVNSSGSFSAPKTYRTNPQIDVVAGAELQFTANRYFSLGLGVSISKERYRYSYGLTQGIVEFDVDEIGKNVFDTVQTQTYSLTQEYDHLQELTYIKFPISLKIHPITIGRFEPYLEIGGYSGLLLGANKTVNTTETDFYKVESQTATLEQVETRSDVFTTNIKSKLVLGTYGWFTGAGVNIRIHRTNLFVGARFQFGLNNIVNQSTRYNSDDLTYDFYDIMDDVRINSGQLLVGWSIPIAFKAYERDFRKERGKRSEKLKIAR
jgi:hypothetical protein